MSSYCIPINQYRRRPAGHVPGEFLKRYRIESELCFRGKGGGQCALIKDGVVLEWFDKRSTAIEEARKLAIQDMRKDRSWRIER